MLSSQGTQLLPQNTPPSNGSSVSLLKKLETLNNEQESKKGHPSENKYLTNQHVNPLTSTPNESPNHFYKLPPELRSDILNFLPLQTLSGVASVSEPLKNAQDDDLLWKEKFERHFPHVFNKLISTTSTHWREEFHKTYKSEYKNLSNPIRKLFSLIKDNDVESLKKMEISLNVLDEKDENGNSLLDWIQRIGNPDILNHFYEIALKSYAKDTGKKDKKGRTILYWAIVCYQSYEEINSLKRHGSSLDEKYFDNRSQPIHIAAQVGRLDIVKALVNERPDLLNQVNANQETPLLCAASKGHLHIVKALIEKHPPLLNQVNRYGETALILAATAGHLPVVEYLLQNNPELLNKADFNQQTPLLWAAFKGHQLVVQYLMGRHNINPNAFNPEGETALIEAARAGHLSVVKSLLAYTRIINLNAFTTKDGNTALHWAAQQGHLDIVKALVEKDSKLLNEVNHWRDTALILAIMGGHLPVIQYLLEQKPELLNRADTHGITPLMWASSAGHRGVVQYLLTHPDVNLNAFSNSSNRMTALHFAATALHFAAKDGHLDILQALIEKNPDLLNKADTNGNTPLIYAAFNGHLHIVEALIDRDPELLSQLESKDSDIIVKFFLKKGIIPEESKETYKNALQGEKFKEKVELLKYILMRETLPEYKTSFTFFGHTFNFGFHKNKKMASAHALQKVIFNGENPFSTIKDDHEYALRNGKLSSIYLALQP